MKAQLIRVVVAVNDSKQAMDDLNDLFGIECYGPYDIEGMSLKVALPRSGGFELISPSSPDDPSGFTSLLEQKGEGIKSIALRVDDLDAALAELRQKGIESAAAFNNGPLKEAIIPAQPKTHNIEVALNEYPDEDPVGIFVARDMGFEPLA